MRNLGRHRYKTHAGIPHGSTVRAEGRLEIYYQYNTGESGGLWSDKSQNARHAEQEVEAMQPATVSGGGLDFEDTNDPSSASQMGFTNFTIADEVDFIAFIAFTLETSELNSLNCWLSDSGNEVLEFVSHTKHQLKTGTTSNMIHNAVWTIDPAVKTVFVMQRRDGATGTVHLFKNGLRCNGNNNAGTTNSGTFDLQNLGVKNNPDSESHWFDGIMYDVGVISGVSATDKNRNMIVNYLCAKHGINTEGNN